MQLNQSFGETRRMLRGLQQMQKLAASPEPSLVGMAIFSTPSHVAVVGKGNHYELKITNADSTPCWARFRISLQPRSTGEDSVRSSFSMPIHLQPHSMQTAEVACNWLDEATIQLNGVIFKPDEVAFPRLTQNGICTVTAELNLGGDWSDALSLIQELVTPNTSAVASATTSKRGRRK
jgi:hypothetical protein